MHDRKKKPTLEQIRTFFPFDVPDLARVARVETSIVYQALLQRPIHRQDAEKILQALSNHIRYYGAPLKQHGQPGGIPEEAQSPHENHGSLPLSDPPREET